MVIIPVQITAGDHTDILNLEKKYTSNQRGHLLAKPKA